MKNQIHIQVQNPGKLSSNESSKGLGLKNLKERLKIQYNGRAFFIVQKLDKNRVEATIILPFEADENI